jgi:succinoglycan biosynthesis transport protein ExoP
MGDPRQEGLDLQRWGQVVRRRKWLLLAIVVSIPAAVFGLSLALPKTYESSTTLYMQPTGSGSTVFSSVRTSSSDAEETATLAQTTTVARRAARILGQPAASGRALLDQVEATPTNPGESKGNFLTVSARSSNPTRAAKVANAFAAAITQIRTGNAIKSIDRTIAALQNARRSLKRDREGSTGTREDRATAEELSTQLQQLRGLKASQAGTTVVVERAVPATAPVSPQPLRNAFLALLVALLIAAGLVPLFDRLDRRLRESGELEELIDRPLLAAIPASAFPGHVPDWHVREAFQTLRAALTYFNVDRTLSTLVVSSPAQWDGKTTVAINLALAYAMDGADVILLDADLRHPQAANRLGKVPAVGLEAVLVGERALEEALFEVDAGGGRLRVLTGLIPPPNPAALLGSQRMRSLLAELSEQSEIVLIDTPALLAVSDAIPLVNRAAGTVLVARLNQTPREAVRRASQVIDSAGGTVLGTVATGSEGGGAYGYYGYYGYLGEETAAGSGAPSSNGAGEVGEIPRGHAGRTPPP